MRRLELYEKETVPIIDFYRKLGKLVVVDGSGERGRRVRAARRAGRAAARSRPRRDHAQDPRPDRSHAEGRARSSPRCTRCAPARRSPARPPPTSTRPPARCSTAAAPARTSSATGPAVPGRRLHVAQRGDRPRDPERAGRAAGGRHLLHRLRRHHRGLARRRRHHRARRRDRRRVAAAPRGDPRASLEAAIEQVVGRQPPGRRRRRRRGGRRARRLLDRPRVRRPRHRDRDARGAPDPQLRPSGPGAASSRRAWCSPSSPW